MGKVFTNPNILYFQQFKPLTIYCEMQLEIQSTFILLNSFERPKGCMEFTCSSALLMTYFADYCLSSRICVVPCLQMLAFNQKIAQESQSCNEYYELLLGCTLIQDTAKEWGWLVQIPSQTYIYCTLQLIQLDTGFRCLLK